MTYKTVKFERDVVIIEPRNLRIDSAFATQFRSDVVELKGKGFAKMVLNLA